MAIFDELRELWGAWEGRHIKNIERSWGFMYELATGFSKYIGAPTEYQVLKQNPKRYVEPLKATQDDRGNIQYSETGNIMDVITPVEDLYWISGLRVVIDRAEKITPKSPFIFFVRFILRDHQCELHIGDESAGKFEIDLGKPDTFTPAYEYMVSFLRKMFALQPWEPWKKGTIGFALPRVSS